MSPLRLLGAAAMLQLLLGCGPRNNVTNARTDSTDGRGDDATTYSGDRGASSTPGNMNTGNDTTGAMGSQQAPANQGLGAGGDVNRSAGLGSRDTDNTTTGTQG